MSTRKSLLFWALLPVSAFAQSSTSDCDGAIQLCGGVYTELSAPLGTGATYEFTGTCNQNLETASLWYTFTVQEAGNLSFILDPANDADDYDWGLFEITNGGCAGINAQDGSSPEVNCSSYGSLAGNGPTGMSTANGGTGVTNGPGDLNGPPFNADLPVGVGQTYALVVMNWSGSPDGYTIDFTQSTASIFDATAPFPTSVELDCLNQEIYLVFSEPIVTTTVEPADFTVTSPSGQTVGITTVTPDDPTALTQLGFTLNLPASLLEVGIHTLSVTSVSANVEDPCGNIVVDTTLQFMVEQPLSYQTEVLTACNGDNGSLIATYTGGGTAPITFVLAGTVLQNDTVTGLGPGSYGFSVTDAAGCQFTESVVIPDHILDVIIPEEQDSLSCAQTSITIEGVQVVPQQTVQYAWSAIIGTGTVPAFSSLAAPVVTQPGVYTLLVTETATGCTDEASVLIAPAAVPTIDLSGLRLPNVISPNGDGKNDVWRPYLPTEPELDVTAFFDSYKLTVLNRWGQVMHETDGGAARSWNAADAADGTYFYTVAFKAECGAKIDQERSGSITVLR